MLGLAAVCAAAMALTACGSSGGAKNAISDAPRVELTKLINDPVPADFNGAPIEVLSMDNPIDFSYSSNEADMIFEMKDGVWLDSMDNAIPLNQEMFAAMADNFLHLHAVSEVTDPGPLSDYGLSDPVYSVYMTDSEHGERDISIGNQDASGNYYLSVNEDKVYTVKPETAESLNFDYDSLVVRDSLDLTVAAADLQSVSVTEEGKTTSYKPSDSEAMARIAAGISALKPSEYASYHILEQERTAAELTSDMRKTFSAEFTQNGETKSLVVYVGGFADADETQKYVQIDGSEMIAVVDRTVADDLLNASEEEEQ